MHHQTKLTRSKPRSPRPRTDRQRATFGDSERLVESQLGRGFRAWLKECEEVERVIVRSITGRIQ